MIPEWPIVGQIFNLRRIANPPAFLGQAIVPALP
jgi:hypothetical protein